MFVSVRKMVSIFESKKQPRPVSLPPSLHTPLNSAPPTPPLPADSEPHPPSPSRPRLLPEEQEPAHVTRRANATLHRFQLSRVRESWPSGKVDYHPRAFRLAVSTETKEPISSEHRPHACLRSKRRDGPSGSSTASRTSIPQSNRDRIPQCSSETTPPPPPQTPAGSAHSITAEKQSVVDTVLSQTHPSVLRTAPSCRSRPLCVTDQTFQRGGARKQRLRPSDSTLLSLLLFFHR